MTIKYKKLLNGIFVSTSSLFLFLFLHFSTPSLQYVGATSGESIIMADVIRPSFVLSLIVPRFVTLDITPTTSGAMTVAEADIMVSTSSPSGYKLFLEMAGENNHTNSLLKTTDSSTEITSSGSFEEPQALTNGTWGYAISSSEDTVVTPNGFDSNYDTMTSAEPTNNKFAAIPVEDMPAQKIAESDELGDDILTVYYGLRAGMETPAGNYTNNVLYTALADETPTPEIEFLPAAIFERGGETLRVITPLYSTVSDIEANVYILSAEQYAAVTRRTNPTPVSTYSSRKMECSRLEADSLQLSCLTLETPLGDNYVYVDIPHYNQFYADLIPIKDTTPENMWELKTLQGFDDWPALCTNLVTPLPTATKEVTSWAAYQATADKTTVVPTHTMVDVRDGKAYQVKKLADGRCWMTENLRLENATLTSADTNLPAGKTIILPASTTQGWCNGNSANCYERLLTMNYTDAGNSSHPEYGSYYNWYTATATYGMRNTTTDTDYSICPAGWHLPKGGPTGEFQALYDAGYNTPALMMKDVGGPHFILSGAREAGATEATGEIGRYWSSTPTSNKKQAYRFYVSESKVQPASPNIYGKHRGLSIRCINDVRN